MLNVLHAVFKRFIPKPPDPYIEQLLSRAIDRIEPRLKSFGNYPKSYRPVIRCAAEYASILASSLPAFIDLDPSRFAHDPLLHALFGDADSIRRAMQESQEIKHYFREHDIPQEGTIYALMGMRRREKSTFGRQLNGDMVQQDMQQTMVYFETHTLTLPDTSEEAFVTQLQQHLFDSLIDSFSEQLAAQTQLRRELETERDMLVSRLRSAHSIVEDLEPQLQAVRVQLKKMERASGLGKYPDLLSDFMAHRQDFLRIECATVPIDMRGVMRDSNERLAGTFTFHDLIGRDRRRWTLLPVRIQVSELRIALTHDNAAERWLNI